MGAIIVSREAIHRTLLELHDRVQLLRADGSHIDATRASLVGLATMISLLRPEDCQDNLLERSPPVAASGPVNTSLPVDICVAQNEAGSLFNSTLASGTDSTPAPSLPLVETPLPAPKRRRPWSDEARARAAERMRGMIAAGKLSPGNRKGGTSPASQAAQATSSTALSADALAASRQDATPAPHAAASRPAARPGASKPSGCSDPSPPPAAPEPPPGPEVVEGKLAAALAKAREMLVKGTEAHIVVMHTKLPLREVFRLQGEVREAQRSAEG